VIFFKREIRGSDSHAKDGSDARDRRGKRGKVFIRQRSLAAREIAVLNRKAEKTEDGTVTRIVRKYGLTPAASMDRR
jgi:hypothetical protein